MKNLSKTFFNKFSKIAFIISFFSAIAFLLALLFSTRIKFLASLDIQIFWGFIFSIISALVFFLCWDSSPRTNARLEKLAREKREAEEIFLELVQKAISESEVPVKEALILFRKGAIAAIETNCNVEFIKKGIEQLK